jgi:ATP-dependent DNA helicase RecG
MFLQEKTLLDLMQTAGRKDRTKFRNQVMGPLMDGGWIEMTEPDKPHSSKQKYRTTVVGIRWVEMNSTGIKN